MKNSTIVFLAGMAGSVVFFLSLPFTAQAQSSLKQQMQEEMQRMREEQKQQAQALSERVEKEITAKSVYIEDNTEKVPAGDGATERLPDENPRNLPGQTVGKPVVKQPALKTSGQSEYEKRQEYYKQQHQSNLTYLKKKLIGNTRLSLEQKVELINYFENLYGQNISFRADKRKGAVAFFEQIVNDDNLTMDQKKEELKKFHAREKEKLKEKSQPRIRNK